MPVSKPPRRKKAKKALRIEAKAESGAKPYLSRAWQVVGAIALFGGLVSTALTFLPRFSLSAPSALDRRLPLSTPIQIQNTGFLTVHDIRLGVGLGALDFGGAASSVKGGDAYGSVFHHVKWEYPRFEPTETIEISMQGIFNAPPGLLTNGDVEIVISYKPLLLPWRTEKRYHLVTATGTDGNTYWKQMPRS